MATPHGPDGDLLGQIAVVTGGGRGVGLVFAKALAAAGATVAVTGRNPQALSAAAEEIEAAGGRALYQTFDVADPTAVADGFAAIERRFGHIDLLVNNAGEWGPVGNLWEVDPQAWWRTMEVHIGGTFNCCRAVLPGMIRRGGGRLVNIVSHAGVHRWPTCSAYSVSKAAAIKLTENLAVEAGRQGVAIFAYHPGLLPIGLSLQALGPEPLPDTAAGRAAAWVRDEIAAGRGVPPERAAEGLLDLASGRADGLSGRYLTATDDLPALARRSDRIRRDDLLTLRLRPMPQEE